MNRSLLLLFFSAYALLSCHALCIERWPIRPYLAASFGGVRAPGHGWSRLSVSSASLVVTCRLVERPIAPVWSHYADLSGATRLGVYRARQAHMPFVGPGGRTSWHGATSWAHAAAWLSECRVPGLASRVGTSGRAPLCMGRALACAWLGRLTRAGRREADGWCYSGATRSGPFATPGYTLGM